MQPPRSFVFADCHFGHQGVCEFTNRDGSKLRPFTTAAEMDEAMVDYWNQTVNPHDKTYIIGDIAMHRRSIATIARLHGSKILIKGNHDCLDIQTECLTQQGWKKYSDLNLSDQVFSIEASSGTASWNPVEEIIVRNHTGKMVRINSGRFSMRVTPNHRVLHIKQNKVIAYCSASDISGQSKIYTAMETANTEYSISDNELLLLAWILTDGSFYPNKINPVSIHIYQSKPASIKRIETILETLAIAYTKTSEGITAKGSLVCGKPLVKDSMENFLYKISPSDSKKYLDMLNYKRFPPKWFRDMSTRQMRLFITELMEGDGSWASNGFRRSGALHGQKEFLDEVQVLCIMSGIRSSISVAREKDYRLNVFFSSSTITITKRSVIQEDTHNEIVWCIRTPMSNFMVRRDGKAFFTGNCYKLKDYMPYFKDIRAYNVINMFLLSHIPIHPDSQAKFRGQIHGHLHSGRVMKDGKIDPWYYCVSAEHTDFRPLLLDEAMNRLLKQKEEAGILGTYSLVSDDGHPG